MGKVDLTVFEELKELLGSRSMDRLVYELSRDYNIIPEEYNYKLLESEGGESQGEYAYSVFQLKDKAYKTEYSYYSHDGFWYDDITETLKVVQPVQKTVTVFCNYDN